MELAQRNLDIVWVDDSHDALSAILAALGHPDLKRPMTTMGPLADSVNFHPLVIDPEPRDTLFTRAEEAIRQLPHYDVVMVDLSFDPLNRTGAIERGRALALYLQDKLPGAAIGVYTKHALRPRMRARVHSDGFDLVFEQIRQLYEDEDSLTGDDWYFIFERARDRHRKNGFVPEEKSRHDTIASVALPASVAAKAPDVPAKSPRPNVFIGSSREGLNIANAIQNQLRHQCKVTVWNQQNPKLSQDFLTSFLKTAKKFAFGIFIFTPNDVVNMRGKELRTARDNVVFELGVFIGMLGRDRTFIVSPEAADDIRVLTDLVGMTPATYKEEDVSVEDDIPSALGPATNEILAAIRNVQEPSDSP